jgi:hypothetical protein
MWDLIFTAAFESAYSAIFEVGAVMAVLMLLFGILDYKYGVKLNKIMLKRRLDRPYLMAAFSLIPVDGTLLFQYNAYKRRSIRPGSLLAGMIGIGEEATYLILSYQPLTWLMIAVIKIFTAVWAGTGLNIIDKARNFSNRWHEADSRASADFDAVEADENFHELPDKFRHKLHHFRYHQMGKFFWIMFTTALAVQILLKGISLIFNTSVSTYTALGIPLVSWLAMIGIMIVFLYNMMTRMVTKEFGKIFEHEFEDTGDAIGDLAEICASVILMIFALTFIINLVIAVIGIEQIAKVFAGREILTVIFAALLGLIPGTGSSLAFTTLYITLAGTPGALPFASLLACSMSLIGDSKFIGSKQIRISQRILHLISAGIAAATGLIVLFIELML